MKKTAPQIWIKNRLFDPIKAGKAGLYVCGPTVYGFAHIGHARTYIFFDALRRFLESQGFNVNYVMNITDVGHLVDDAESGEDKIEKEAKKQKTTPETIARFYEKAHFEDMLALKVARPKIVARASEHIPDILRHIKILLQKKIAYEKNGNVYFDVSKFSSYGEVSGQSRQKLKKAVRIKEDLDKKDFLDFALWKKADPSHLLKWDSPWGKGYPGWHIECSVISAKYLGQPFDIHGGGGDLIFPHHENEVAQSKAAFGKPLANYFIHTGSVLLNNVKMSRSKGNVILIKDLLKKYPYEVLRLALLSTHYSRPLDIKDEIFEQSQSLILRWRASRQNAKGGKGKSGFKEEFIKALSNDFNTPLAISLISKYLPKLFKGDFALIETLLGVKLKPRRLNLTKEQKRLLAERLKLRQEGKFGEGDKIRQQFARQGILIEDTKKGYKVWAA